ncbi:MAG TPA: helix-turn-helix transcriptional regulator [Mycobacteriales bacterium]|nr:helix-turn-helix transcriptional regulator [Mycobacteriales bacterium]
MLALLDGELHGFALAGRVAELSDGTVRMGPGTRYGTLKRLADDGLIEETTDRVARGDNERRRYYQLTADLRALAVTPARWRCRPRGPRDGGGSSPALPGSSSR